MKKNILKTMAAATLAVIGTGSVSSIASNAGAEIFTNTQELSAKTERGNSNCTQNPINENLKQGTKITFENNRAYNAPSYYNVGIPPKIYGMFHAKRKFKR